MHEDRVCFAPGDFDAKGRIRPSSLMFVFQEAATAHAEKLGAGFETLMAQNYIWVLTKLKFKVNRELEPEKAVQLQEILEKIQLLQHHKCVESKSE